MSDQPAATEPTPARSPKACVPFLPGLPRKRESQRIEAKRLWGEDLHVVVALAFCALGVYLAIAAIAQINAAARG